ncbi:hypothetical protein F5051DRAFT_149631 [Lentinula edodes]|nr:hypothetical protein F5051DRAFT_149631 [Lentinula edodes]
MSSSVTRQAIPAPKTIDTTSRKRPSLDDASDAEGRSLKKLRGGDTATTKKDKKKRKKKKKKQPVVASIDSIIKTNAPTTITSSVGSMPAVELLDQIKETSQPPSESAVPAAIYTNANVASLVPAPDTSINDTQNLNAELATKSALISTHENAMSQVQQNITCQICLDLLYKPYALAPCGHIACYSCLMSWFSRPPDEGADAYQPPIYLRKKSCPHCRATVRDPPVEVWAVKNMVNSLVGTGLLVGIPPIPMSDGQPVASSSNGRQPGSGTEPSKEGLWKNIFYPHRDTLLSLASREDAGIRDDEDGGVYRCIDCMYEITGGFCTNCHRVYRAHRGIDFGDDSEGNEDVEPFFRLAFDDRLEGADYEEDDEEDDDYYEDVFFDLAYHLPLPRRTLGRRARVERNRALDVEILGSDSEEDEVDRMDGFIDDDSDIQELEDVQEIPGDRNVEEVDLDYDGVGAVNSSHGPSEVIEVTDEEDDDDSLGPARPVRRRVNRAQTTINLLSDDEDEGEEESIHLSDDDSEEIDDDSKYSDIDDNEVNYQDDIHSGDDDDPDLDSAYLVDLDDEQGDIYRF